MAVSAAPRAAMAWVCPECGHGSPEPRDRQAHLDAHRQLRRFFDEWEAAGAAEQAGARPRRRRPLYYVAAALVLALLAGISLRSTRPPVVERPPSAAPVPGVEAPQPDAGPPPGVDPRPAAPAPAPNRPGPPPAASVPRAPTTPAVGASAGLAATQAPAPGPAPPPAAVTPPPAAPAPAEPLVTIRGCVLQLICITLGR